MPRSGTAVPGSRGPRCPRRSPAAGPGIGSDRFRLPNDDAPVRGVSEGGEAMESQVGDGGSVDLDGARLETMSPQPLLTRDYETRPSLVYERLRQQHGPVAPVDLLGVPAWLVLGYRESLEVLQDDAGWPKGLEKWRARSEGRVAGRLAARTVPRGQPCADPGRPRIPAAAHGVGRGPQAVPGPASPAGQAVEGGRRRLRRRTDQPGGAGRLARAGRTCPPSSPGRCR